MRYFVPGLVLLAGACAPTTSSEPVATASADMYEGVDFAREPGAPALEETYPDAAGMPRDVQAYVVRWNDCQHWAGEPAFDAARRRQIEQGVEKACTGVDDLGRRVRARHAANPAVIERLKEYDNLEN